MNFNVLIHFLNLQKKLYSVDLFNILFSHWPPPLNFLSYSLELSEQEEVWKCQPVRKQNIKKVSIIQFSAIIHKDIKHSIFHLRSKTVMRTENGTTLIHLRDKCCNEKESIQATNIWLPFKGYFISFIMQWE